MLDVGCSLLACSTHSPFSPATDGCVKKLFFCVWLRCFLCGAWCGVSFLLFAFCFLQLYKPRTRGRGPGPHNRASLWLLYQTTSTPGYSLTLANWNMSGGLWRASSHHVHVTSLTRPLSKHQLLRAPFESGAMCVCVPGLGCLG